MDIAEAWRDGRVPPDDQLEALFFQAEAGVFTNVVVVDQDTIDGLLFRFVGFSSLDIIVGLLHGHLR
jgi:hypothetical protein